MSGDPQLDVVFARVGPDTPPGQPPEDRVLRVRVASFPSPLGLPDLDLWRFVRRASGSAFDRVRLTFRRALPGGGDQGQWYYRTLELPGLYVDVDFDSAAEVEVVRAMRWAAPLLGLVDGKKGPLLGPLLRDGRDAVDPYLGRFRGRTIEEVLADAEAVDARLQEGDADLVFDRGMRLSRRKTGDSSGPWWTWTVYEPWTDQPLGSVTSFGSVASVVRWMMDLRAHPSFVVLPAEELDRWWSENSRAGKLSVSEDELEVYRVLGERLPYLWPADEVSRWAIERWGPPAAAVVGT